MSWSVLYVVCFQMWSVMNCSVMNMVCYELVCYERGLLWTWSVMNVVCYECGLLWTGLLWRGRLWTWSVTNVVCFEWSVVSGLLWTGLFWKGTCLTFSAARYGLLQTTWSSETETTLNAESTFCQSEVPNDRCDLRSLKNDVAVFSGELQLCSIFVICNFCILSFDLNNSA